MLRNVNSQTNVKIDINHVIDNKNMQEHNKYKELGIFVFAKAGSSSLRSHPSLEHFLIQKKVLLVWNDEGVISH